MRKISSIVIVAVAAFFLTGQFALGQAEITWHNLPYQGIWVQHEGPRAECQRDPCAGNRARAEARAEALASAKERADAPDNRPDLMGLRQARIEAANQIAVAVGEVVGMNEAAQYYSGLFYSYGISRFDTIPVYPQFSFTDQYGDLGRALQRETAGKLRSLQYTPIAPQTGAASRDREVVLAEGGVEAGEIRMPEYVFVLSYGLLNEDATGTRVNFGEMAGIAISWINNLDPRIARAVLISAGSIDIGRTGRSTAAMLSVAIYNFRGEMVKEFTGTKTVSWKEFQRVSAVGVDRTSVHNPSMLVLANQLVEAAFARFGSASSAGGEKK